MHKKIMFFLYSLSGGGAERTVINIINNLNHSNFEVLLVLGTDKNNDYINLLNKNIRIRYLNSSKLRYCILKLSRYIKEEEPDLIFSTINANNVVVLLARILSFKNIPTIVREASHRTQSGSVTIINKVATRFLYNHFAQKIIALSYGVKGDLVKNFQIKESKIDVIYNPVEVKEIKRLSNEKVKDVDKKGNEKLLIAVGRLVEAKNFNMLLKAFKRILQKVNSRLIILGKGPKEEALKHLTKELGIEKKVSFLGFKHNPYKYMRLADVFILSSKWEGFSHVIVEAMATGTPVISTDCKSGPGEIIKDDYYGKLVPVSDDKKLAEATIELLKDYDEQQKLIERGYKRIKDFDVKKIVQNYEAVFEEVIKNKALK